MKSSDATLLPENLIAGTSLNSPGTTERTRRQSWQTTRSRIWNTGSELSRRNCASRRNGIQEFVENAEDVICTADLEGNFTSVNRAAERVSGYPRSEVIGRPFGDFVAPESRPLCSER